MHPQAAVVIPCYNSGKYLPEAVESAMKQDIEVELIVIDDGSTDPDTVSVLDKLRSDGIKVFRQENKGISEARNSGVRLTPAEYVVCLDADDLILPQYCSACLEVLRSRPDTGFVYSTSQVFGAKNKLWSNKKYSGLNLLIDNYIPNSAMFRRKVWEQLGGFSLEMKGGYEDWDFWLGAVEKGWKGFHIAQPLFMYRKHGASMLGFHNLQRRKLKRLIHARHSELYSARRIRSLLVEEHFPFPRLFWAMIKEYVLRKIYWSVKGASRP